MKRAHNTPLRDCNEYAVRLIELNGSKETSEWQHCIGYSDLEEAVEDIATQFLEDEDCGVMEAWTFLHNQHFFSVRCEVHKLAHLKKITSSDGLNLKGE